MMILYTRENASSAFIRLRFGRRLYSDKERRVFTADVPVSMAGLGLGYSPALSAGKPLLVTTNNSQCASP